MTPYSGHYLCVNQFVRIKDDVHWSDLILVLLFAVCQTIQKLL